MLLSSRQTSTPQVCRPCKLSRSKLTSLASSSWRKKNRNDFRAPRQISERSSWRNAMKKLSYWCLLGALCLPMLQLHAQEKPKSEERVKVPTPVKVQIVFTEFDGEKKVSSMPYIFTMISDEKVGGRDYSTSVRTGVRVPIELESKDQKITYLEIGTK